MPKVFNYRKNINKLFRKLSPRNKILAILCLSVVTTILLYNALVATAGVVTLELLPQPDAGLNSTGTVWTNWNQTITGSATGWTNTQGYTTAPWYVTTDSFDPTGTAIGSWRSYRSTTGTTLGTASIYHTFTVPAGYNSAADTLTASFYWKKLIGTANVNASNVRWQIIRDSDAFVMGFGTLNNATALNTNIDWTQATIDLKNDLDTSVSAGTTYRLWLGHESRSTGSGGSTSTVAFDVARVSLTSTQVPTTVSVTASKSPIVDDNVDSSTITVNVLDQFGNPINGQTVNFTKNPNIGSFSASSATTDASGNASVTFKGNGDGGSIVTMTATAGSASGQTSVALARAGTLISTDQLTQPDAGLNSTGTVWANWNQTITGSATGWTNNQGYTTAPWYMTTDSFDPTGTAIGSWRSYRSTTGTTLGTASIYHTFTVPAGYNSAADTLTASFYWKKLIGTAAVTTSNVKWQILSSDGGTVMGSGTLNSATTANTNIDWTQATIDLKNGLTTPVSAGTTYRLWLGHESRSTGSGGSTSTVAFDVSRVNLIAMQVPTTVSVTASKPTIEDDNTDLSTVTATVYDQFGDPINGQTVDFTKNPNIGSLSAASATTNASGQASVTFKANNDGGTDVVITATAGSVNDDVTVTVLTPTTLTVSVSPATIPNDNTTTSTITAHLVDDKGAAMSGEQINFTTNLGTLSAASATTDASGNATVTIKSATGGTTSITAQVNRKTSVTGSANVIISAPTTVTMTASPAKIPNDNTTTTTITAHVVNHLGNPIEGVQVDFSKDAGSGALSPASATTNASGDATVTFKSDTASSVTITGTANRSPNPSGTVVVTVQVPTTLTVSTSPAKIPNDDTTTSTITAHLVDQDGGAIAGEQINFATTLGTLSAATAVTNASGNAVVTIKSATGGIATITGTVNRTPAVTDDSTVTIQAPTTLTITRSPATIPDNDITTSTITAHLVDQYGAALSGEQINFTTTLGTLSAASVTTNSSGDAVVTLRSAVVGTATVTGTVNRIPAVTADTTVSVVVPIPTAITVARSPASVPANNITTSTVTAHATDQNGNPLVGATINFSTNLGTLSAASAVTNASGNASVTVKSGTPGLATVTAVVSGSPSVNNTGAVTFTAPSASGLTLSRSLASIPDNDTTTSTITAHLIDQGGQPLGGVQINFATNKGTLSAASATTNASGDASVTIRSAEVGIATITAVVNNDPAVSSTTTLNITVTDNAAPTFVKAEATSKQIVYLTFSEEIQDPATAGSTINVELPLMISQISLMDDARIVKLVLAADQDTGNQYPAVMNYDVSVTDIKDLADNTLASASQSFDAFSPHGKYALEPVTSGSSNRMCGQCHVTHGSIGPELLNRVTITKTCFVCHGTTGISVYKVEGEFTTRPGPALSYTLHKSLDYDNPGADVLFCTDCHNPHGDKRSGNDIYPKLLKVADFNGTFSYQGNGFCLACHGLNNKALKKEGSNISTFYDSLGGDHRSGMTAQSGGPVPHYSTTIQGGAMAPVSGTNVTCIKCHERHGSKNSALLDNNLADNEEVQCYKCHGDGVNYSMNGINVYNVITTSVSQHKVGSTAWGKIECSSCHGPHIVSGVPFASSTAATSSAISNPDNTKQGYTTANGDITGFCLRCHDGAGPSKTANSTTIVPFDISFVDIGFTTNGGGWNKAGPTISYVNSKHYTAGSNIQCTGCHEWHGTAYDWLLTRKEDNATDPTGQLICFKCHAGSGGIPNVKAPLGQTYNHPTLTRTGVHSNRENYNGGITTRHAECYDCHDVHTVKSTTTTQMDKLGNASGVKFGQTAWDSWADATATPVYLDPTTNNRQAYLCYKCHSKYAGNQPNPTPGSSGYTPGTFAQTDVAKEFNPSNKARHVVEGTSQMPTFDYNSSTYYYGKFVNGWTATSVMKCTDCHMPASGAVGPHGSTTRFILKAAWTPTQGASMASTDLCFLCHDYDFYYSGGDVGSATLRSQFSGGSNGYNGHATKHKAGKQNNCSNCHGGLPHGWKYTDSNGGGQALWSSTDARPYKDGSYMGSIPTNATKPPEQWTGQHSGTSCGSTGGCT